MKSKDNQPENSAASASSDQSLRLRAEEIARENAMQAPKDLEACSPEEVRRMLHELRVHQIELEMQNDELRRAQVELDAARARYFDLYDLAPVGYCTLSEEGIILEANLNAASILGVARSALLQQHFTQFIHREDQDLYYQHRQQLFASLEPQTFELRMLKDDGAVFWVRLAMSAAHDADGQPVCRVMMSDITEQKRSEEAVRESEAHLRSIFRAAPIGIGTVVDRGIRSVNEWFCQMLGYAAEELVGQNARIVYPSEDEFQYVGQEKYRQIKERGSGSVETRFVRKDGRVLDVLLSSTPIDANDWSKGVTFTAEDITKRKQAEAALLAYQKQLQALALKLERTEDETRRRIAGYLHDQVGQALAAVRVRFAAWKAMAPGPGRDKLLFEIEQLIDGTIDETRKLTFDLSPPILFELGLGPALEWLGETCCENIGLYFTFHDDGGSGGLSEVLASALYRIARELLLNVVKHAQATHVSISISCDDQDICLVVADDGVGIGRARYVRALGGLGGTYGLFSIRERVLHLGGSVEIESNPGEGTCATLVVPLLFPADGSKEDPA